MFRITEDPSSGSIVQCLAKNYKNDSIVSVDMEKVGFMVAYSDLLWLCVHKFVDMDLVHVNGQNRIILVIFSQALYNSP